MRFAHDSVVTRISLEEEQVAAVGNGWLEERYYSSVGDTVGDILSFRSVYEINPFEVGADHSAEHAVYSARRGVLDGILDLTPLRRRPFMSLSNGELRRVVLARALLRESGKVVLVGGCGGLDPEWRRRVTELSRAMRPLGLDLCVSGRQRCTKEASCSDIASPRVAPPAAASAKARRPLVEMAGVGMSFGRRILFKDFSWTIREGERWVLKGPNGSGKTTLLALITGDSPFAYACDIKVFGRRRGEHGVALEEVRSRIGSVSSLRQAYLGIPPEAQLNAALRAGARLLLLDEPCCNMTSGEARAFARRVQEWLCSHPRAAAVWVEHRPGRIPPDFTLVKSLGR